MATAATTTKPQSRISGALSLVTAQAVVLILGYVTHLWIGRVLGPGPYGIYGVVLSVQTIFSLFLTLGIPVAISRYAAQDEMHAQSILRQGLRLQAYAAILITVLVFFASSVIAWLLQDSSLTPYFMFVAFVIFSQAFYPIFNQFFSGMHLFNRQALLTIFYAIVKLVSALTLIYFIYVYGAFAGFMLGGIAAGVVGWYSTRNIGGHKNKLLPVKKFLSFAGVYVLILVGLQILISLDLFMVKAILHSDTSAGYYNAAVTLSRISFTMLQALGFILLPSVAKLTKPGAAHDKAASFISDTIRYLIALIVPSVALAAATSKSLIIIFFSSTYIPAAPVLTVLMIGLGGLSFYMLLANIAAGAGRPAVPLYITIAMLLISPSLGLYLIPRLGLIGAAWQTTTTGLIGLIVISLYTFRSFKIPLPIHSIINISIASFTAVLPTYLWRTTPLNLPLHYLLALVIYLAVMILLREITPADRARLASLNPRLNKIIR
ncbi:MAG: oligosaccharide flippase family protein [bacterium]|nr:oligosaccharide flippase family protein [bacterium]MDZ4344440.1 oligosaccharide flippase family protein [Candidatus Binatia bacterium]